MIKKAKYGAVAAGHEATAAAAMRVLESGGNAFDAVIAATATACICEPVLASLGGGGFLTTKPKGEAERVYDFFVQTPKYKCAEADSDFYPVTVDFGTTQQNFQIGMGSIATPGIVKGLFAIHDDFGYMPMHEVLAPAIELAKQGVRLNKLQSYLYHIVSPILNASAGASELFSGQEGKGVAVEGDLQRFPEMADLMEGLASEGSDLFYRGEVSDRIATQCLSGGHLSRQDLMSYEVVIREPHRVKLGDYELISNPPPSSGGILIGFALQLLAKTNKSRPAFGSAEHLMCLTEIMSMTNKARIDARIDHGLSVMAASQALGEEQKLYEKMVYKRPECMRGTTHISVADNQGNQTSLTLSNGEGCGSVVPGCGFMLNNMLGEEDLNPKGFGHWATDVRMTSMMAPSILRDCKLQQDYILGSGGSNRIRSAILQTVLNIMKFEMPVTKAIAAPRIHYENNVLNVEPGFSQSAVKTIKRSYSQCILWQEQNLYFGGVHGVMCHADGFSGAGDARRGGIYQCY